MRNIAFALLFASLSTAPLAGPQFRIQGEC